MSSPESSNSNSWFQERMNQDIKKNIQSVKEKSPSGLFFQIDLNPDKVRYLRCYFRHIDGYKDCSEPAARFSKSKSLAILRSLIGIVAIDVSITRNEKEFYKGYKIPPENRKPLFNVNIFPVVYDGSLESQPFGSFVKPLKAQDISILRAVWERNTELYEKFKHRFIPSFHQTEVAKLSRVEPRTVGKSLLRLSGLLARKDITLGYKTRTKWFVPASRRQDIKILLDQNPHFILLK